MQGLAKVVAGGSEKARLAFAGLFRLILLLQQLSMGVGQARVGELALGNIDDHAQDLQMITGRQGRHGQVAVTALAVAALEDEVVVVGEYFAAQAAQMAMHHPASVARMDQGKEARQRVQLVQRVAEDGGNRLIGEDDLAMIDDHQADSGLRLGVEQGLGKTKLPRQFRLALGERIG